MRGLQLSPNASLPTESHFSSCHPVLRHLTRLISQEIDSSSSSTSSPPPSSFSSLSAEHVASAEVEAGPIALNPPNAPFTRLLNEESEAGLSASSAAPLCAAADSGIQSVLLFHEKVNDITRPEAGTSGSSSSTCKNEPLAKVKEAEDHVADTIISKAGMQILV
ncbi:unnamed protein product, partial [Protopolystoma xenopodis]